MSFRPGDKIAGRYEVESVIASGGMGVIYAGRHLLLDERVAIKCLLPELSKDTEQVARLVREARSAAKIKSEHVARILDADCLPDGTVFLAMERLEGTDLDVMLEQRAGVGIAIDEAVSYVLQASEALAEAHALGIVHRDLKPANLFASRRPDGSTCIKVLDFGISKLLDGHDGMVRTKTGAFMGTPMYASPEQLNTPTDVDRRADVWALGCVLYELIAGVPPFASDTMGGLLTAILTATPAPFAARRADVPPGLEAAVLGALTKDRTHRHQDIVALALAIAPFAPAQAAVSAPRVQAVGRYPSSGGVAVSSAFAATESGAAVYVSAPPPPPPSGAHVALAHTAHARTVASWQTKTPAPAGATLPSPSTAASKTPWVVAGLALALAAGAVGMTLRASSRPPATEPSPAAATSSAPTTTIATPQTRVIEPAPADAAAPAIASPAPPTGSPSTAHRSRPPTHPAVPGAAHPAPPPSGKTNGLDLQLK